MSQFPAAVRRFADRIHVVSTFFLRLAAHTYGVKTLDTSILLTQSTAGRFSSTSRSWP
jgi:hypothetical protein